MSGRFGGQRALVQGSLLNTPWNAGFATAQYSVVTLTDYSSLEVVVKTGPAPRGAFRGRAPTNENSAPQARTVPQRNYQAWCYWSAIQGLRLPKYRLSPQNS